MAIDYFLKIEGVEGESKDATHKDQIQVESFSWGASQAATASYGGGQGAGKVNMHDFSFTTRTSKASPELFLKCCTGAHLKSAIVYLRKSGEKPQEYLKITLSDCLVSSFQAAATGGGSEAPSESVSLNFSKVEFEYKEQKADGSLGGPIKVGYDIKTNSKV